MTVRPPQALAPSFSKDTGLSILEYELMSERADALGRHGLKVEKALELLAGRLAAGCGEAEREDLLNDAADKVWAFFIQREICGLRSQKDAIRRYAIPPEVIARLGIVRRKA
ncbi:hypothetical protein KYK30_00695 [Shinella yambaruensis]|uniref:Uncharacterized protein n=1 Tax=Shinella yambaruensis TaxID=415996 RepID=A0ABQ5ZF64_9HYPH|nr:DUF6665 family protein [Shinella yambaruensis]MCJ8026079.1 hypothetical protein [Shinella yambaruensis]MCU7978199.1 hypothetical protein [Shinella yambaruensis]GLR50270.1 hypothetical protein GCM10007923_14760 [Shinella yambaruensis]